MYVTAEKIRDRLPSGGGHGAKVTRIEKYLKAKGHPEGAEFPVFAVLAGGENSVPDLTWVVGSVPLNFRHGGEAHLVECLKAFGGDKVPTSLTSVSAIESVLRGLDKGKIVKAMDKYFEPRPADKAEDKPAENPASASASTAPTAVTSTIPAATKLNDGAGVDFAKFGAFIVTGLATMSGRTPREVVEFFGPNFYQPTNDGADACAPGSGTTSDPAAPAPGSEQAEATE